MLNSFSLESITLTLKTLSARGNGHIKRLKEKQDLR